jgi:hypothetical protein
MPTVRWGRVSTHAEQDAAFIRAFVAPTKRERIVELLSKPKRRREVLRTLAHFGDLDPRFCVRIPSTEQSGSGIARLLRKRGAPAECYLISEAIDLDGKRMPLPDALERIVAYGMGTLLSCIPGRLGYYEGEARGERYLLEREGCRT